MFRFRLISSCVLRYREKVCSACSSNSQTVQMYHTIKSNFSTTDEWMKESYVIVTCNGDTMYTQSRQCHHVFGADKVTKVPNSPVYSKIEQRGRYRVQNIVLRIVTRQ